MAGLFLWKNEMPQYFSPVGNDQIFDSNGDPLVGGQIETYLAGSSTPTATYTDNTGGTPQSNPIILNTLGYPTLGAVWLTGGKSYKFVIKDAGGSTLRTIDNIVGIGDTSVSLSEWVESGLTPTYITGTSFSVPGDQTLILQIDRRLRTTNTSGLVYSTISNSVFAAGITTVTLVNDSTTLDAGLSQVAYALLAADPLSVPNLPASKITGSLPASQISGVLAIVNGGTGANDAGSAFNNIKQTGTESSSGVFEVCTTAESQAQSDNTRVITAARLASALQGSNQALGSTGYQRLPGGIIIQWGNLSVVGGGQVITFALAYPAVCYSVVATAGGNNAASNTTSFISSIGTSGFTLTNASGTTNDWKWIAIGR